MANKKEQIITHKQIEHDQEFLSSAMDDIIDNLPRIITHLGENMRMRLEQQKRITTQEKYQYDCRRQYILDVHIHFIDLLACLRIDHSKLLSTKTPTNDEKIVK